MSLTSLPLETIRQVLASAPAPTLVRFAGTCHAFDILVIEELNFQYNRILATFVSDPPALRTLLHTTTSKIAGSVAALICGFTSSFTPGDLDVYCDVYSLPVLRDHLVVNEHYEVIPDRENPPYRPTSDAAHHAELLIPITDVDRTYHNSLRSRPKEECPVTNNVACPTDAEYASGIADVVHLCRGQVFIDLVSSTSPASAFPIVNFWSTAPMCFLTDNAIHVLYPHLQEMNRALLSPSRLPPSEPEDPPLHLIDVIVKHKAHTRNLIAKYTDRSYDIQHTEHAWDPDVSVRACTTRKPAACPLTPCWVGDSSCMAISLCGDVNARMHTSPEDLGLGEFTAMWTRGGFPCGPFCSDSQDPVEAIAYTSSLEYIH